MRTHAILSVAFLALCHCSLNPQPLPPDQPGDAALATFPAIGVDAGHRGSGTGTGTKGGVGGAEPDAGDSFGSSDGETSGDGGEPDAEPSVDGSADGEVLDATAGDADHDRDAQDHDADDRHDARPSNDSAL